MNDFSKLLLSNLFSIAVVAGTVALVAMGKLPTEALVPTILALLARPTLSLPSDASEPK